MRVWDIYPAIDLRQGRVVRLMQGDPDRETQYAEDPLHVARRWQEAGTDWLHVVNLDGALDESGRQNLAALERVLTTGLKVQFGGGMRDLESIRRALDLGVSRAGRGGAGRVRTGARRPGARRPRWHRAHPRLAGGHWHHGGRDGPAVGRKRRALGHLYRRLPRWDGHRPESGCDHRACPSNRPFDRLRATYARHRLRRGGQPGGRAANV